MNIAHVFLSDIYIYIYNKSMILPIVFHWGYMLLNPLGDIYAYILNPRIGHCASLEQVNFAITFSFGYVYVNHIRFATSSFG